MNEDKVVAQIIKEHVRGMFSPEEPVSECDLTMSTEDLRGTLNSAIREAITLTRKQVLEEAEEMCLNTATNLAALEFIHSGGKRAEFKAAQRTVSEISAELRRLSSTPTLGDSKGE